MIIIILRSYYTGFFCCFYLCTFDITQKHGPVSRHVDGDQYEEAAATVAAVVAEEHNDAERAKRVGSVDGKDDEDEEAEEFEEQE